jgi:hypothetical protein
MILYENNLTANRCVNWDGRDYVYDDHGEPHSAPDKDLHYLYDPGDPDLFDLITGDATFTRLDLIDDEDN